MRWSFVTLDTQTNRGSSAKSQNTNSTEQVSNKGSDAQGPSTTSWPLFRPTGKRGSRDGGVDEPPSPFIVECISRPKAGKRPTVRPARRREVLKNVRKLLSRTVCLTASRAHFDPQLQVFMEVRRETFCDPEWDDDVPSRAGSTAS